MKITKIITFTCLYVFAEFICNCLGFFHPFLWLYHAFFCAILAAWPYNKIVKDNSSFGMAIIPGTTLIISNLLIGEGDTLFAIIGTIIVCLAEATRNIGGYHSLQSRILSYVVLSQLPFANTLRMWIQPEITLKQTIEEMGIKYANQMETVNSVWLLLLMIVLTILSAAISMMICNKR